MATVEFDMDGKSWCITLTETQFDVVRRALGISMDPDSHKLMMYADKSLESMKMMGENPLRIDPDDVD